MIPSRAHLQSVIIGWLDIILQQNAENPIAPQELPGLAMNLIQNINEGAYGCLSEDFHEDVLKDNPRPPRFFKSVNEEHPYDMLTAMHEVTNYLGFEDDPLKRKIDGYIDAWLEREYQFGMVPKHYRPTNTFRDEAEEVMEKCRLNEHPIPIDTVPLAEGYSQSGKSKLITLQAGSSESQENAGGDNG